MLKKTSFTGKKYFNPSLNRKIVKYIIHKNKNNNKSKKDLNIKNMIIIINNL